MAPSLKVLACGFLTDKEVVPLPQFRGFFHVGLELSPLRPEAGLGVQTLGHVSGRAGPWVALWSRSHVAETSSSVAAPSRLVLIPAPLWAPLPPREGPSSRFSYPRHQLAHTWPPVGAVPPLAPPRRPVLPNAFSEAAGACLPPVCPLRGNVSSSVHSGWLLLLTFESSASGTPARRPAV